MVWLAFSAYSQGTQPALALFVCYQSKFHPHLLL